MGAESGLQTCNTHHPPPPPSLPPVLPPPASRPLRSRASPGGRRADGAGRALCKHRSPRRLCGYRNVRGRNLSNGWAVALPLLPAAHRICPPLPCSCVAFVSRSANFLIDGVSSKVGRSVGQRDWGSLDTHIQLSLRWSLLLGAAAVPLLLASRTPLLAWLLALAPEVQAVAAGYWLVRSAAVPLQLLCMSAAGVLQGFGRVRVNAALASGAAVLEMLGSALVLRLHAAGPQPSLEAASLETSSSSSSSNLVWLGCVTLACQLVLAAASLSCIALLPPAEARVSLRQVLFSRGGGSSSSSIEASQPAGPEQPLLDDGEGRPGDAPIYGSEAMTGRAAWLDRATLEFLRCGAFPVLLWAVRSAWFAMLADMCCLHHFLAPPICRDGLNMFLRTMVLQLTFFLALASAARLGTTALAGGLLLLLPFLCSLYNGSKVLPSHGLTPFLRAPNYPSCSALDYWPAVGRHFLRGGWLCSSGHRAGQQADGPGQGRAAAPVGQAVRPRLRFIPTVLFGPDMPWHVLSQHVFFLPQPAGTCAGSFHARCGPAACLAPLRAPPFGPPPPACPPGSPLTRPSSTRCARAARGRYCAPASP